MHVEAAQTVYVTNHAVRRFAERADGIEIPRGDRTSDAEALRHLSARGYPVEDVRRMIAAHAEAGVRAGAAGVPFDRVVLCLKGRGVVSCLPKVSAMVRRARRRGGAVPLSRA